MNLINIETKEKMVIVKDQPSIIKSVITAAAAGSSRTASTTHKVIMVGFDDVLLRMLDKITGGGLDLQIIPIVGMGGIGKTTLAGNLYVSPLVQHHFDVRAWSTISQKYNAREILRQVLDQLGKWDGSDLSEDELGLHLYQYLIGRRYFIVMDDMWNIEAWDGVRRFFPDNSNGSRIVVTTRLSNLASEFNYSNGLDLKLLDEDVCWNLFSKTVFGEESCPLELEDIGKKIVRGCKGLPLSVAVIGGLLSKSERTKESWRLFEKNISSIVNLDDNESCLQVLYMSYNNLPVHLKPCFLYMGRYDEDDEIPVSQLIILYIAEGFVKAINGKSLEEAAEDYVEELVNRNMLIVEKRRHSGKLKSLKMHDLMRDVCLREARKLKFLCVLHEQSIPQGIYSQRRIKSTLLEYPSQLLQSLGSASLVRSFFGSGPTYSFRLLRVGFLEECLEEEDGHENYEEFFLERLNLRLLVVNVEEPSPIIPSSVSFLWNLQTLILLCDVKYSVFEIWKMPQLRHVMTKRGGKLNADYLPGPPSGEQDIVLENLQTLYTVKNLKFGAGVLKRIHNMKKMKLYYEDISIEEEEEGYCLNNLCCLNKLETLRIWCYDDYRHLGQEVSFPYSLKKLVLINTYLRWEDMKTKIGALPLLEVLKLKWNSFIGSEWETCEDQFLNLRFLLIEECDLECWITYNTHFPRLEHLVICDLLLLSEIPMSIGDIPTLQSIKVERCSDSVVDSAEIIKEEQEEFGNEDLQIIIVPMY
ncbi:putative late blight resistance protein homolog R1B-16 isoform X2 [Salvia splendens]|nr:putative late blight resistance protein homolog R1B-16 isoform X2 [Salvia splendens]XP_042021308.1 putative late blight resistance protein homolog R1B-16 isoform X2 [Salvia splendens]XP_042021309.1 putative late blight resistance protein homolog R1B-16 isoform X2 [Salvia splendens]XP_042021310.1 putative late blight resistance protein homolog R1B-16 isoform X2 [Salvia splendens]